MWTDTVESAPGTVTQVRGSAQALIRFAKRSGAAVILVGHVTKDGQIAGPRVVEHMVDAVLSFEGEGSHQFRILRAVKNRFGPTDEIGVFEMTGAGLREVANPSELFLSERDLGTPGTAVFAGIEGTRPLLVEIQALVAPTSLGTPRRAVVGWDQSRLVDGARRARSPLRRASCRATTSISTSPAACASRSRPPISPPPPRWSPRSPMRRCRPTRSISARSRCRARCGRWRRPRRGSRRRRSSASPAPSCRRPRAAEASVTAARRSNPSAALTDLVADIAARGRRRARPDRRAVGETERSCATIGGSLTRPWNRIAPVASSTM